MGYLLQAFIGKADKGTIVHSDGSGVWKTVTLTAAPAPLYGIWGTSARDVYAFGANGTILHLY